MVIGGSSATAGALATAASASTPVIQTAILMAAPALLFSRGMLPEREATLKGNGDSEGISPAAGAYDPEKAAPTGRRGRSSQTCSLAARRLLLYGLETCRP